MRILCAGLVCSAFWALSSPAGADGGVRYRDLAARPGGFDVDYRRTASPRLETLKAVLAKGSLSLAEDLPRLPGKPYGAPGVAIFDFDRDGDLDVYVSNGPGTSNSLLVNHLQESGELSFTDRGASLGAGARDQDSTGVCFGDVDNDGDHDLVVLGAQGPNLLFENRLDRPRLRSPSAAPPASATAPASPPAHPVPLFADVTRRAAVGGGDATSTSCSLGDVNGDGWLDLAVANSYDWSSSLGLLVPFAHNQPNQLFLNRGDGTFEDVSDSSGFRDLAGLPREHSGAAGVTWAIAMVDLDLDGDADILTLGNRGSPPTAEGAQHGLIRLHRNDGSGHFTDVTREAGLEIASAWLGISFGDFDRDRRLDFFATNAGDYPPSFHPPGLVLKVGDFSSRWFLGQADGSFRDPGLGRLHASVSGWGTSALDYDNDGDTDVVYHGGLYSGFFLDAGNPGAILQNRGGRADFDLDTAALSESRDHNRRNVQGVAAADLDRDGFVDLVTVSSFDIPPAIALSAHPQHYGSPFDATSWRVVTHRPGDAPGVLVGGDLELAPGTLAIEISDGGSGHGAIEIELLGSAGLIAGGRVNRDGIGAVVHLSTPAHADAAMRPVLGGSSYASQDALPVHFGLGSETTATVEVLWPGGVRNRLEKIAAGERLLFPEIPCDFQRRHDAPERYATCVGEALDALLAAGVLDAAARRRFEDSAFGLPAAPSRPAPGDAPPAASWTQFRGPERSGKSPETGLLRSWPEDGPPILWRRALGEGFSGITVGTDALYTLYADGEQEYLAALSAGDGHQLWRLAMGPKFLENFGNGPRATPTLDGATLYALGARGRLAAVDLAGEELWRIELQERYPILQPQALLALAPTPPGPQLPVFGYAGSPLVVDDLLILETGAGNGKSFVALDKRDGSERWSALDAEPGYASPVAVTLDDVAQIVVLAGTEIVSLSPAGEVYWRHPWAPTTAQPVIVEPDGVLVSTVSGVGAMLLRVGKKDGGFELEERWRLPRLRNAWNSSVLHDRHVYGFDNATLRCVAAETGEMRWAARGLGQGTLIAADGLLLALGDRGKLALIEATPERYQLLSETQLLEGRTWTAPTLSKGRLFVRDHDEIVALDLRDPRHRKPSAP